MIFTKVNFSMNKNPPNRNSLKSRFQVKFRPKISSHQFKTLRFGHQSRDHFKNIDCSASNLIFSEIIMLISKPPYNKNSFKSRVQIKLGKSYELTNQNIKILPSLT